MCCSCHIFTRIFVWEIKKGTQMQTQHQGRFNDKKQDLMMIKKVLQSKMQIKKKNQATKRT